MIGDIGFRHSARAMLRVSSIALVAGALAPANAQSFDPMNDPRVFSDHLSPDERLGTQHEMRRQQDGWVAGLDPAAGLDADVCAALVPGVSSLGDRSDVPMRSTATGRALSIRYIIRVPPFLAREFGLAPYPGALGYGEPLISMDGDRPAVDGRPLSERATAYVRTQCEHRDRWDRQLNDLIERRAGRE